MIRVTASSIRLIGIRPARTSSTVAAMNCFQSSGTMIMSMPALIASTSRSGVNRDNSRIATGNCAIRSLNDVKARLFGAVLNDIDSSKAKYGDYYGYGYSTYGYYYGEKKEGTSS